MSAARVRSVATGSLRNEQRQGAGGASGRNPRYVADRTRRSGVDDVQGLHAACFDVMPQRSQVSGIAVANEPEDARAGEVGRIDVGIGTACPRAAACGSSSSRR